MLSVADSISVCFFSMPQSLSKQTRLTKKNSLLTGQNNGTSCQGLVTEEEAEGQKEKKKQAFIPYIQIIAIWALSLFILKTEVVSVARGRQLLSQKYNKK